MPDRGRRGQLRPGSAERRQSLVACSCGHGIPEDEPPGRVDGAVRSNGRHPRPAHGNAADPPLGHAGSDVVLLDRPRRHLQQHRAHTIPPPADRVARRRPRGLVVRAVLHRCRGRGAEMSMPMPPETTMVVQRPMSMADFAGPEVHTVDTKLLIQDTHVHVPMYGLIAAALGVVVVGLSLPRRRALGLIALLFAAPWLDFAGMWLTKLVSPRFAIVTIAAGWAMGVAYLIVAALAIHQMWLSRERG